MQAVRRVAPDPGRRIKGATLSSRAPADTAASCLRFEDEDEDEDDGGGIGVGTTTGFEASATAA